MSGLRVDNLKGTPTFPDGVVITGETSSTSFSGNLTGNVTGNVTGIVTGNVTGNVSGTSGSFSGNVSVGGSLSYGDVTNVDSVGVITARGGIKIGAGQSVSAVSGIITYYGDGSQLGGIESGFSNFVASGTVANGANVVVNTDGTVSIITQTGSANPSVGSPVVFQSSGTYYTGATYDSTNGKVVLVYRDNGASRGKAIVGTVSGTSISFGSAVEFHSSASQDNQVEFVGSGKVVVAYQQGGNPYYGKARVGTISGNSISFGTEVTFESANTVNIGMAYDSSNDRVVIAYRDGGNSSYGTAIVGTVSGTSISFGSPVVFNSASTRYMQAVYDSANSKIVIVYRDDGNSDKGTAIVGTVSGTSISFGSAAVFESGQTNYITSTYDSTNQKVVIAYGDWGNNSGAGTAVVGTVSGTSISFGTPVVYETSQSAFNSAVYDSAKEKVVIAFRDNNNSSYGTAIVGTVSGDSISFGTPVVFESAASNYQATAYDSTNEKVVIAYYDAGNSDYGTAVVFSSNTLVTNLTASNYIGIAAEAISNGATGKVNVAGGVNSGQTGLTTARTYYVQGDGSLGTSAGNPSVVAGTSISTTQIIVKG